MTTKRENPFIVAPLHAFSMPSTLMSTYAIVDLCETLWEGGGACQKIQLGTSEC